jgi:hypothetical protein
MIPLTAHPAASASRTVWSGEAGSVAELARDLRPPTSRFVLFIAADALGPGDSEMHSAATNLLQAGASYVCCWGPGCERLHDAFDTAALPFQAASDDDVIMTTWHDDESLEEAVWFAVHNAWPTPAYERDTRAVVAVAVGAPQWASRINDYLQAGAPFPDEV